MQVRLATKKIRTFVERIRVAAKRTRTATSQVRLVTEKIRTFIGQTRTATKKTRTFVGKTRTLAERIRIVAKRTRVVPGQVRLFIEKTRTVVWRTRVITLQRRTVGVEQETSASITTQCGIASSQGDGELYRFEPYRLREIFVFYRCSKGLGNICSRYVQSFVGFIDNQVDHVMHVVRTLPRHDLTIRPSPIPQ